MFAFGGGIYYDMYILYKGGEDMRVLIVGGGAAGMMAAGMAGTVLVIGVIVLAVMLLNKLTRKK